MSVDIGLGGFTPAWIYRHRSDVCRHRAGSGDNGLMSVDIGLGGFTPAWIYRHRPVVCRQPSGFVDNGPMSIDAGRGSSFSLSAPDTSACAGAPSRSVAPR